MYINTYIFRLKFANVLLVVGMWLGHVSSDTVIHPRLGKEDL